MWLVATVLDSRDENSSLPAEKGPLAQKNIHVHGDLHVVQF